MLAEQLLCPLLIGRDAPLTAGFHALERVSASHGSTLLVSGEAGIGKSRYVRAMLERARSFGFLTLQGACFEADRAHPYAPVLDLVRVLAQTASPALAAHYFGPASTELVTLFPELRAVFPDTEARVAVDPDEGRRRLFHSFTEAIHALGKVQPLLLVVEDVHWSDDATLDLMLHLARNITSARIALVLTFRSDEVGPRLSRLLADFDRARCAAEVGLRPLSVQDVSAMLRSIFGSDAAFGNTFVSSLHGLTEGNPFFIEEMLKALLVAGDLEHADGSWRARPLENVRLPRTATEAVDRRLAGLSPEAGKVAAIAAVAGRRFDFALLQSITQHDESSLLSLVKELLDAQLVVEESADRFAFRHALTREAMRARLMARERVALHRAIANALEQQHHADSHEHDDALAHHTFEAGMWEQARQYALNAAARALALSAPREALRHFDRAVVAAENQGIRPDAGLLIDRGRAHETLGAFQQANDDFTRALESARSANDKNAEWAALYALGLLWAARDYERAGRYRREALDVARAIGEPTQIARSLNRVGNWFVNREDPWSGLPSHDEALAIFEKSGDKRGICETVDLLAMTHHMAGMQRTSTTLYERAIELFSQVGDRRGLITAMSVLTANGGSYHVSSVEAHTSALRADVLASERPLALAAEIEWRAGEAFSRYLLADAAAWNGNVGRGLQLARESLTIAEEIEHLEWQCGARRVLGHIMFDLHATQDALVNFEAAHAIARRLRSASWTRWTAAPLAIALVRFGQLDRAEDVLQAVEEIVPTNQSSPQRTLGQRFLAVARAELLLASGDAAGALERVTDADAADSPRTALLRARAHLAMDDIESATPMLAFARAGSLAQQAKSLAWQVEAVQGAAHLRARQRLESRRAFDVARAMAAELILSVEEPRLAEAFERAVDVAAPPQSERTPAQRAKAAYGGLTRRERDAAALIAQGKSNRAIAKALGIGERTVESYVASALGKLGFASRAQIAVWATEQGIAAPESAGKPRH